MKIEFIGKCLLIENEKTSERVLVVGDLHLGYERALRNSGVMMPLDIFEETKRDFDKVFDFIGSVDRVVLLGDVKHEFGSIPIEEWKEVGEIMNYLRRKSKGVIIVKGNHDAITEGIIGKGDRKLSNVEFVDYYFFEGVALLHGDRDFPEIHGKKIKTWVVGHGHPAIVLGDKEGGVKKEKYKCFLDGKFGSKRVIIVPSFFVLNEGSDARAFDLGLAWDFKLDRFNVEVVGEGLEVLDFGRLSKL